MGEANAIDVRIMKNCEYEPALPHFPGIKATICRKIKHKSKRGCTYFGEPGVDGDDERYCFTRIGNYNVFSEYLQTCVGRYGCNSATNFELPSLILFIGAFGSLLPTSISLIRSRQTNLYNGEIIIDQLDFVEDTKGNGGDKGRLLVTNLRIVWHSLTMTKITLSIGYNCIQQISTKMANSRLKGITDALHILSKYNGCRYEFIFTNLIPGSSRHFTSVMNVHKAYQSSRIYRELKLRGAIVQRKRLKLLDKEKLYFTVNGVWNLSSDQGNLGYFVVTNVRLVWFAEMNETFNISLPYIQIASIRIRDSRFGTALVIESTLGSGGFVLGFRIDPLEQLRKTTDELRNILKIHLERPELGVYYTVTTTPLLSVQPPTTESNLIEFDETLNDLSNALALYSLDKRDDGPGVPEYCPDLGLAIEKLPDGFTMKTLWDVFATNHGQASTT